VLPDAQFGRSFASSQAFSSDATATLFLFALVIRAARPAGRPQVDSVVTFLWECLVDIFPLCSRFKFSLFTLATS
jgi:hypothetical protein